MSRIVAQKASRASYVAWRAASASRSPAIFNHAASLSAPAATPRRQLHATPMHFEGALSRHKEDPEWNTLDKVWEFTPENQKQIDIILKKYPANYKRSAVMPLLHLAQKQTEHMPEFKSTGWVPLVAMNKIATILDMPPMRVYEVASFYTMYNRTPIGKHNIQVCTTSPCMVCGAYNILEAVKKHLGVEVGETTKDGLFHLMEAECLGCCVNAPMMQIAGPICNDAYYEDLTPESAIKVIEDIRAGKAPKKGSQIGRLTSRGKEPTALTSEPKAPPMRTDGAF